MPGSKKSIRKKVRELSNSEYIKHQFKQRELDKKKSINIAPDSTPSKGKFPSLGDKPRTPISTRSRASHLTFSKTEPQSPSVPKTIGSSTIVTRQQCILTCEQPLSKKSKTSVEVSKETIIRQLRSASKQYEEQLTAVKSQLEVSTKELRQMRLKSLKDKRTIDNLTDLLKTKEAEILVLRDAKTKLEIRLAKR